MGAAQLDWLLYLADIIATATTRATPASNTEGGIESKCLTPEVDTVISIWCVMQTQHFTQAK